MSPVTQVGDRGKAKIEKKGTHRVDTFSFLVFTKYLALDASSLPLVSDAAKISFFQRHRGSNVMYSGRSLVQ